MALAFRGVTCSPIENFDAVAPDGVVVGIIGESVQVPLTPRVRRGDGRAEIQRVETVGENGKPTMVWRSGERALVKVAVRFREEVADPVIGIMIRTRIGLNVYGTNTELEQVKLGPCSAGATIELAFAFWCELCP